MISPPTPSPRPPFGGSAPHGWLLTACLAAGCAGAAPGGTATPLTRTEGSDGTKAAVRRFEPEGDAFSEARVDLDRATFEPHLAAPAPGHQAPLEADAAFLEAGDPAPAAPDRETDHRHVVYTAELGMAVFDLEATRRTLEDLPRTYGGYIASMSMDALVLRVPAPHLRPAMHAVEAMGVVRARSLQAREVTAEFVDLEARLSALQETRAQLLALLARAQSVEDALEVRKALDAVTMELEVLRVRMRRLQDLLAYSTLTVRLVQRGPFDHALPSDDPFPWVDQLGVEATAWH